MKPESSSVNTRLLRPKLSRALSRKLRWEKRELNKDTVLQDLYLKANNISGFSSLEQRQDYWKLKSAVEKAFKAKCVSDPDFDNNLKDFKRFIKSFDYTALITKDRERTSQVSLEMPESRLKKEEQRNTPEEARSKMQALSLNVGQTSYSETVRIVSPHNSNKRRRVSSSKSE